MKKILAFLLCVGMILVLAAGCGSTAQPEKDITAETTQSVTFTDSCGREVRIPASVERVAVSGPSAQMFMLAIAPERMIGIASDWSRDAEKYLAAEILALPFIGQLYGGKGTWNPETLLTLEPDIVLDIGESKAGIAADMDALQEQIGIPCVHVDAYTATMGDTFRLLGKLLNKEQEAKELGAYCDEIYGRILALAEQVQKKNILYVCGEAGLNVIAKSSYHAEVIDLLANNLAVVDSPSAKGTGNETDMEQMMLWGAQADAVIFAPESIYEKAAEDPMWQSIPAIAQKQYFRVPMGPYNWMGFPPSVQRYLGMLWMGKMLYPQEAEYDLYAETARYYQLFYHCDLTQEMFDALMNGTQG